MTAVLLCPREEEDHRGRGFGFRRANGSEDALNIVLSMVSAYTIKGFDGKAIVDEPRAAREWATAVEERRDPRSIRQLYHIFRSRPSRA